MRTADMKSNEPAELSSVFLVRSEHLNHQGHLFGGQMMAEFDTIAYCLLRGCYGEIQFVTRAAEFSFENPAKLGDVVSFCARRLTVGRTSIKIHVCCCVNKTRIGTAIMTFVNINSENKPIPIPRQNDSIPGPFRLCDSID